MDGYRAEGWKFTAAEVGRLADVTLAACAGLAPERRQIVAAILQDTISEGGAERVLLGLAEPAETVAESAGGGGGSEDGGGSETSRRAGVVAIVGPDDSANLLALGGRFEAEVAGSKQTPDLPNEHAVILERLLVMMHGWLQARGVTFCQAMRSPDDRSPMLVRAGYRKLATIDYMGAPVGIESAAQQVSQPLKPAWGKQVAEAIDSASLNNNHILDPQKPLQWHRYEDFFQSPDEHQPGSQPSPEGLAPFLRLVDHVNETYTGSLDCPAIAEFRSTEAVLSGYRQADRYDGASWLIASTDIGGSTSESVGCLLLTPHPAGGSLEVTYMGLVPRWRGAGLAGQFIRRAKIEALRLGIPHLTLAVDRENIPAIRLYCKHGFELLMSESVWGRKIG